MAEFGLLDGNVCNIYRGTRSNSVVEESPSLDMLRIARQNDELKKTILDRTKYMKTLDDFHVPKAPAFRKFNRKKFGPVMKRLMKPTICQEGFNADKHKDKLKNKNFAELEDKSCFPGYQKIKKDELNYVVARLLRPTHMSMLKQRLPPPPLNLKSAVRRELAECYERSEGEHIYLPPIDYKY